jgi:hypothetical protein
MMDSTMPTQDDPVQVYKDLSDGYQGRGEPAMRDRFLVLAADAALRAGRADESERLRLRLLKLNPHHMLKPYLSFTQAMQAPDVQTYVGDLRLNYPPEVAVVLLNSLRTTGMKLDDTVVPLQSENDDDATVTLGDPTEPLKVYPDQHERDAPETAALPRHLLEAAQHPTPKTPAPRTPLAPPRPPPSSHNTPRPAVPMRKPAAPRLGPFAASAPHLPPQEAEPAAGGGWFAVALFVLVFVTGLILTGYLVARPFLS